MRRKLSIMLAAALAMTVIAIPASANGHATIVETVLGSDDFDILEAAVLDNGLAGALEDVTVFAPTDKAFVKLAEDLDAPDLSEAGVIEFLRDLPAGIVANILLYHVSDGELLAADVLAQGEVTTFLPDATFDVFVPGKSKSVRSIQLVDNDPDARNPKFVKGGVDIQVSNGVIHVIDRVLRPIDL